MRRRRRRRRSITNSDKTKLFARELFGNVLIDEIRSKRPDSRLTNERDRPRGRDDGREDRKRYKSENELEDDFKRMNHCRMKTTSGPGTPDVSRFAFKLYGEILFDVLLLNFFCPYRFYSTNIL